MTANIPLLPTPRARDGDGGQCGTDATGKRGRNLENVALEISQGTQAAASYDDALRMYGKALDMLETACKAAIIAQLSEFLPDNLAAADRFALALKEAERALESPQGALDILRSDLADLESRMSLVASQAEMALLEERIEARVRLSAYDHECGLLREKIRKAEQDMISLAETRNEAAAKAERALAAVLVLGDAIANPLTATLAIATEAYETMRKPLLPFLVLVGQDESHPEYEQAYSQLEFIAAIAGFKLVADNQASKRMFDHWRDEIMERTGDAVINDKPLPPAPSGGEIIRNQREMFERIAADKRGGDLIEDSRKPAAPVRIPVTQAARDYLEVQRLHDTRGF